jgi:hypothetical protein
MTYYQERSYARFDISSLAGKTINSANVNFYVYTAGNMQFTIRQSAGEVDPETGNIQTIYNNAAGTSLATITNPGTVGWKQASCTTYVDTHKGGYCDFGILPTGTTNGGYTYFASSEYTADTTKRPYLYVDYSDAATGTNMQINIGDVWKDVTEIQINIGDTWKTVATGTKINIGDVWKDIF